MSVNQLVRNSIECINSHIMITGVIWSGKRRIKKDKEKFYKKKKCNHKKVHVIANGPSLNDTLPQIGDDDVITVNYSLRDERIQKLTPKIHVLIDAAFAQDVNYLSQLNDLMKQNIVGEIVVSQEIKKSWCRNFGNVSNLSVINTTAYLDEYKTKRDKKNYENNFLVPHIQTVTIGAVYIAIQEGYSDIYLHGCDMTWIKDLIVRDDNVVCQVDNHFYNTNKSNIVTKFSMLEWTRAYYNAIFGFCQLKHYADDEGVNIYNMSRNSMLDMFEKKWN